MLPPILEQVDATHLQQLIADEEQEGKYIEYKAQLYRLGTDQKDRVAQHEELLKDVSSFANTEGGDLIIGMAEENGIPKELCGFQTSDPDALKQRLNALIQQWLEPRLTVSMHAVRIKDDCHALVIRIPKSLLSPHRVIYQNRFGQFWARNSAGAYMMDTTELRRAFTLSETVFDRIKAFREDRVKKLLEGNGSTLMGDGPKMIAHLIPLASFAARTNFETGELGRHVSRLRPLNTTGGCNARINMDGIVTHDINDPRSASFSYVQLFRNGIIECVGDEIAGSGRNESDPKTFITHYEKYLLDVLPEYLSCQQALGIPLPVWLFLTFTGMKGVEIVVGRFRRTNPPIDREILALPEVEIGDYEQPALSLLKPLYDMLWNAAGYPGTQSFDAAGNWRNTS